LDGHEEYAGRKTLVRLLRDRRPELSPRAACAQVVFWGHCLVAWSVRRQRQNGEIESAELFEDLFSEFSLGMVAESLLDGPVDRRGASAEALARVREFLLEAAALPGEVQDALIVMLDNSGVTALAPVALPDS